MNRYEIVMKSAFEIQLVMVLTSNVSRGSDIGGKCEFNITTNLMKKAFVCITYNPGYTCQKIPFLTLSESHVEYAFHMCHGHYHVAY